MKKIFRIILWTVFILYCLVLIYILFLSRPPRTDYSLPDYFLRFSNLIPLKTIIIYIRSYSFGFQALAIKNLVGNLVLFLPMGMALPCLSEKLNCFWKICLCVLGIVVAVELVQGLLRVGSIDIDDVIFNVSGAVIGYGIIKLPFINKILVKLNFANTEK